MSIEFDTVLVRDRVNELRRTKTADPKEPPPTIPALNMRPRCHDVVRWDHDGFVTKTSHETKETALEFAGALHWAATWKWAVYCGRELVERCELTAPGDYQMAVRLFECEMARRAP